jgi:hypothetical protein
MNLYETQIRGFVLNLQDQDIYLDKGEVTELFELTIKALDNRLVVSVWHEEDIVQQANEMGVKLTSRQLDDIFSRLNNIDANIGVNWESIDMVIQEVVDDGK